MRYFISLSYDGTNYSGWQTQPDAPTVQETIEKALTLVSRSPEPIAIVGAGRTDAGVHARGMVAHVDLPMDLEAARELIFRTDRYLPHDIALHSIRSVTDEAHARFSATSRTYRYYVTLRKDPFQESRMLRLHFPLDFDRMNVAAEQLLHFTDFTSFSKLHTDVKTNNCRVTEAYWRPGAEPGQWIFTPVCRGLRCRRRSQGSRSCWLVSSRTRPLSRGCRLSRRAVSGLSSSRTSLINSAGSSAHSGGGACAIYV